MFFNLNKIKSVAIALAMLPLFSNVANGFEQAANVVGQKTAASNSAGTGASAGGVTDSSLSDNGPDGKDSAGVGLPKAKAAIDQAYANMVTAQTGIKDVEASTLEKSYKEYAENWQGCIDSQSTAATSCLDKWSPILQDAFTSINMLLAVASSSVNDSCSKFAKAMQIGQAALTAYTAQCGTFKGVCGWKCSSARDGLKNLYKILSGGGKAISCIPAPTSPEQEAYCETKKQKYYAARRSLRDSMESELNINDKASMAGKTQLCTGKYLSLIGSAGAGIASLAASLKQGNDCDDASSADGSTATTTSETCAIEANASLPECICLKNPMLEGCGSIAAKSSMSSTGSGLSALSATGSSTGTDGLTSADLASGSSTSTAARDPSSSSGSAAAGAPTGGGASLGGGSGFGSGSGTGDDKSGHKALDTNILGGSGGGGGGGGMWGGNDSSGDKSGLRSYLPGGAKDPLKMGGQQNSSKEVTGQGGKSNWEKVRERYQDNKATLINN